MDTFDSHFTAAALTSWKRVIAQIDKGLEQWTDADLQTEVSPGRNRLYYLLGHLTAVHDHMLELLRLGDRLYPNFDEQFIRTPDRAFTGSEPSPSDLRKAWTEVNTKLTSELERLSSAELLERHNSISEEDFAKEPHRNRLTVFLGRLAHAAMHEGQMRLVRPSK